MEVVVVILATVMLIVALPLALPGAMVVSQPIVWAVMFIANAFQGRRE